MADNALVVLCPEALVGDACEGIVLLCGVFTVLSEFAISRLRCGAGDVVKQLVVQPLAYRNKAACEDGVRGGRSDYCEDKCHGGQPDGPYLSFCRFYLSYLELLI